LRQPLHVVEHDVNVDRLALDRPLVGEHLHAVDELYDAVGLVADKARKSAVVVLDRLFEKLCGAANARQRVLDLVGEHRRKRNHRARRSAMRELAIHLFSDGALLEHHHDVVRPFGQRRNMQVDDAVAGIARRAEIDLVLVDRGTAGAHLIDEGEERTAERHEIVQQMAPEQRDGNFKKRFRRHVGVGDLAVCRHDDDRMGQRVEHRVCGRRGQQGLSPHGASATPCSHGGSPLVGPAGTRAAA
jgi:hypothetical protein